MSDGLAQQDYKQVKVTIIETRHVSTDAANFKSVVHQYTGKNSNIARAPHKGSPLRPRAMRIIPVLAQSQMAVENASSTGTEATILQNQSAFVEDFEPILEDMYEFIGQ